MKVLFFHSTKMALNKIIWLFRVLSERWFEALKTPSQPQALRGVRWVGSHGGLSFSSGWGESQHFECVLLRVKLPHFCWLRQTNGSWKTFRSCLVSRASSDLLCSEVCRRCVSVRNQGNSWWKRNHWPSALQSWNPVDFFIFLGRSVRFDNISKTHDVFLVLNLMPHWFLPS